MLNLPRFIALLAAVGLASCGPSESPKTSDATPASAPKPVAAPAPAPEKKVAEATPPAPPAPVVAANTKAPAQETKPATAPAPHPVATRQDHNWTGWRGPLQMGESVEHHSSGLLVEKPEWTFDSSGRGTPVIAEGKVFTWGYRGERENLEEVLACLDEKDGHKLWEITMHDFLSDVIYNRYSIGAPVLDVASRRVYLFTAYGLFVCVDFDGKEIWRKSLMEEAGRMTFPNAKVGSAVIEGDLVICHAITSNWGSDGPPSDRFYAYDKMTGELVWFSTPGEIPPKDNSHSTPVLMTIDGQRVIVCGSGCGNIVILNARSGKPLWRYKMSKGGVNASVLIHKGKVIAMHGEENTDNADKGRMVAIKLPQKFGPKQEIIDFDEKDPALTVKWKAEEVWRAPLRAETSSPILVGDHVYDVTDVGNLVSLNANTGEREWDMHLTPHNIHSSPLYGDGLIYFPAEDGYLYIVKPGEKSGEVVQKIKLEGICLGAPAICNGRLYVHTFSKESGKTGKFYCFKFQGEGAPSGSVPAPDIPKAGLPAALQIVPAEFAMHPGEKFSFHIRSIDAHGMPVAPVAKASWESFIPPTAKVKATVDAKFDDAGELVSGADAKLSAGAFKASAPGPDGKPIFGIIRGRILPNLPIKQDFEEFNLTETQPTEGIKYAYPPLPWIGARYKYDVRDLNGNKVLAKTLDNIHYQRSTVFISTPDKHDYTMQADVMTDGSARSKSDVGLINQRYMIVMRGNAGQLEISSNMERLYKLVPITVKANVWYVLKCRVDVNKDGSGIVHAKFWEKTNPEPEAWTLDAPVPVAHKEGSPGIFSFTQMNQRRIYLDNLLVTPNK